MTTSFATQTIRPAPVGFQEHELHNQILPDLDRLLKSYIAFHIACLSLASVEFILLLLFFPFLYKSSLMAFGIAVFILTLFIFMVGRQYVLTQKNVQLEILKQHYFQHCRNLYKGKDGSPDYFRFMAHAYVKLAEKFQTREYTYCQTWRLMPLSVQTKEKLSCRLHWKHTHRIKEMLLLSAIEQHLSGIKVAPTSLEAHADLAHAYVTLSGLYYDPRKIAGYESERWIPPNKYNEVMEENFRQTAQRAIEEFKIITEYAPEDPWVHLQLAYSYHDLQMPEEEIKEYEIILGLRPGDPDMLFKLGTLYFKQGQNAKGLRIYEHLKRTDAQRSDQLITYYGAYHRFKPLKEEGE